MTIYDQGDAALPSRVVLIPFPFTDQSGGKQRPAVVLSGAAHNRRHSDVILAPITSQVGQAYDEASLQDWHASGLLKPSVVKPLLSSLDVRLIRRKLGALSALDRSEVRALFARVLDLPAKAL